MKIPSIGDELLLNRAGSGRKDIAINALEVAAERDRVTSQTLLELEKRQDDVLTQLDELDQRLTSLLQGLGVTFAGDDEASSDELNGERMSTDLEADESILRLHTNGDEQTPRHEVSRPKLFHPDQASRRAA